MFTRLHDPIQLLQQKIEATVALTAQDRQALAALPIRLVELRADQDIVRQSDKSLQSCLLIQGLACSSKVIGDGKRQIVAFHLPGDMPDLHSFHLGVVDTTVSTMTACTVGIVLHEHLRGLLGSRALAGGLWRSLVTDAAITREWVANVGQRRGVSRTAHLLSELITRMRSIGAEGESFDMPITQEELGEALGMSVVHVNRCLQALRRQGLISWIGSSLSVLDQEVLADVGDFSDEYLHLGSGSGFAEKATSPHRLGDS